MENVLSKETIAIFKSLAADIDEHECDSMFGHECDECGEVLYDKIEGYVPEPDWIAERQIQEYKDTKHA